PPLIDTPSLHDALPIYHTHAPAEEEQEALAYEADCTAFCDLVRKLLANTDSPHLHSQFFLLWDVGRAGDTAYYRSALFEYPVDIDRKSTRLNSSHVSIS